MVQPVTWSVYMLIKAKNAQKLQYYLITGSELGGGGAGVHKIFFVWYPTVSPKNLSYEVRDCYYQKMRQKSRYKIEYIT